MAYEIVSTHFVAHEHDLADAYELYRARVAMSRAEVVAISPRPHPIDSEFFLWDLRCQAAYENLPAPDTMQLYELNALVDFVTTDRDEAVEDFFFEGPTEPTAYPAFLGGLADFKVRDAPTDAMSLITVIQALVLSGLFLIMGVTVWFYGLASSRPAPFGPLLIDATLSTLRHLPHTLGAVVVLAAGVWGVVALPIGWAVPLTVFLLPALTIYVIRLIIAGPLGETLGA